jgi:deoxyribonuclease-4
LFTASQRQWLTKPIDKEEIKLWHQTLAETGLKKIMSHDSYLINLGSSNPEILMKSEKAFEEEIKRCLQLGITFLNFHPGSAVDASEQQCLDIIVNSLKKMAPLLEGCSLMLLLEATAGQGSSVGWRFEHLHYIIDRVKAIISVGVCIDTCHIFVAGYDIRTKEGWSATLKEFDQVIGLDYLQAFHLNDSLKGLGSKVDRHKPLGEGEIGLESFKFLMKDPRTRRIPKYLETPGGLDLWKKEIELLRGW